MRKFAVIQKYRDRDVPLPERKTRWSAGYDLAAGETVAIPPQSVALIPTGLKVYMEPNEFLAIYIRSSLAIKKGLVLANQVGIIDADYVDNPDNEGHILIALENRSPEAAVIEKGERVAQAIFTPFHVTVDDAAEGNRQGGFGSTGS